MYIDSVCVYIYVYTYIHTYISISTYCLCCRFVLIPIAGIRQLVFPSRVPSQGMWAVARSRVAGAMTGCVILRGGLGLQSLILQILRFRVQGLLSRVSGSKGIRHVKV